MTGTIGITGTSLELNATLSDYFDAWLLNTEQTHLAYILYARTAKLMEECGEVMEAVIGYTGDNPRKGKTHTIEDVQSELCDVILTALCALHTTTHDALADARLVNERIRFVYTRMAERIDFNALPYPPA